MDDVEAAVREDDAAAGLPCGLDGGGELVVVDHGRGRRGHRVEQGGGGADRRAGLADDDVGSGLGDGDGVAQGYLHGEGDGRGGAEGVTGAGGLLLGGGRRTRAEPLVGAGLEQHGAVAVERDHRGTGATAGEHVGTGCDDGADAVGTGAELRAEQCGGLTGVRRDEVGVQRGPAGQVVRVDDDGTGAVTVEHRHDVLGADAQTVVAHDGGVGAPDGTGHRTGEAFAVLGGRGRSQLVDPDHDAVTADHARLGRGAGAGDLDQERRVDAGRLEPLAQDVTGLVVTDEPHHADPGAQGAGVHGRVRRAARHRDGLGDADDGGRGLAGHPLGLADGPAVEDAVADDDDEGFAVVDRGDEVTDQPDVGGHRVPPTVSALPAVAPAAAAGPVSVAVPMVAAVLFVAALLRSAAVDGSAVRRGGAASRCTTVVVVISSSRCGPYPNPAPEAPRGWALPPGAPPNTAFTLTVPTGSSAAARSACAVLFVSTVAARP